MAFRLEIEYEGEDHVASFDKDVVAIGRDSQSDVVLDDNTVSRKHARIQLEDDSYSLSVLSKSGLTAIEGKRVTGRVPLEDGAVVHFGTIRCVFHIEEAATVVGAPSEGATEKNPAVVIDEQLASPEAPTEKNPAISRETAAAHKAGAVDFEDAPTQLRQVESVEPAKAEFEDAPTQVREAESAAPAKVEFEDEPTQFRPVEEAPAPAKVEFEDEPTEFRPVEQAPSVAETPAPEPAEESPESLDEESEGENLVSWDQIASSEEAQDDAGDDEPEASDFEKIQAAAAKAEKQSKTSPIRLAIAGLLIATLLAVALLYDTAAPILQQEPPEAPKELPPITFMPGEIDCVGEAECLAAAKRSYKIGIERLDHVDVVVANRFDGWKHLVMAERYIEKAKLSQVPGELSELEERKKKARAELDSAYKNALQNYDHHSRYKMYEAMVEVLNAVKAQFPHEGAREYKWAIAQERALKATGDYPMRMRRGPNRR